MSGLLVGIVLLALAQPVAAAALTFVWEFPRSDQPSAFVITETTPSQQQRRYSVAASAPGACPDSQGPDTFCAQLPTCPGPGQFSYAVAATQADGTQSPASNVASCAMTAPCVGTCTPTVAPSAPAPGPVASGTPGSPGPSGSAVTGGSTPASSPPIPGTPAPASPPSTIMLDLTPPPPPPDTLPAIQSLPALPAFQPAASRAPV